MEGSLEENILRNFGGLDRNCLLQILDTDNDYTNELNNFEYSPYFSQEMFVKQFNEISKSNSFTMLSLSSNAQSLHAKFDKLILLLEVLRAKNLEFSLVLYVYKKLGLIIIQTYHCSRLNSCITKGKYCTAHGGLIIYLHNRYDYKIRDTGEDSSIWEGLFIDIFHSQSQNHIDLGNIYRPPKDNNSNANIQLFIDELHPILQTFTNTNTILCGDFNIDLLQVNQKPLYIQITLIHS